MGPLDQLMQLQRLLGRVLTTSPGVDEVIEHSSLRLNSLREIVAGHSYTSDSKGT